MNPPPTPVHALRPILPGERAAVVDHGTLRIVGHVTSLPTDPGTYRVEHPISLHVPMYPVHHLLPVYGPDRPSGRF
jgi:hypothetical protein